MVRNNRSTRHQVNNELDSLRRDVSRLRSDLAGLADALLHAGKSEAEGVGERISEAARERLSDLRSAFDSAREMGSNAIEAIEEKVGSRPVTSLVIAFAVGLVIGKVATRS